MGRQHDSEPLVSPRGDESEGDQPPRGDESEGDRPVTEAREASPTGPAERQEPPFEAAQPAGAPESQPDRRTKSPNMLPTRRGRGRAERTFVRVVATGGVVGIGVVIAAIMASSNPQGWLIGLVVSVVSVVLAAVLWSSRVL
jgi:hypothetical protein